MVWSNTIIWATTDGHTIPSQIGSQFHSARVYPGLRPFPLIKLWQFIMINLPSYASQLKGLRHHTKTRPNHKCSFCLIAFSVLPAQWPTLSLDICSTRQETPSSSAGPSSQVPNCWLFNKQAKLIFPDFLHCNIASQMKFLCTVYCIAFLLVTCKRGTKSFFLIFQTKPLIACPKLWVGKEVLKYSCYCLQWPIKKHVKQAHHSPLPNKHHINWGSIHMSMGPIVWCRKASLAENRNVHDGKLSTDHRPSSMSACAFCWKTSSASDNDFAACFCQPYLRGYIPPARPHLGCFLSVKRISTTAKYDFAEQRLWFTKVSYSGFTKTEKPSTLDSEWTEILVERAPLPVMFQYKAPRASNSSSFAVPLYLHKRYQSTLLCCIQRM